MPLPSAPFDAAKSIFAGLSVIQLKLLPQLSGVTAATDTLTKVAHGLQVGQLVQFVSGTGFTGLVAGTNYFVVAAPSADTFKLAATKAGAAIAVGTSTDGVFAPVAVFEVEQLDDDPEQEEKELQRPDAAGVLRTVRTVQTKSVEKFTFGLSEVKRLLEIFGGALSGRVNGTATIWIPDPDDASGKVSLKSEDDFACVITRDGKLTFGNSDFSKASIRLKSLKTGPIAWTADATV